LEAQVFKNDVIKVGAAKSKGSTSKKKRTAGKTAKLKSSDWYQGAARSIGITKERSLDKL
jgi:hypothetical protein